VASSAGANAELLPSGAAARCASVALFSLFQSRLGITSHPIGTSSQIESDAATTSTPRRNTSAGNRPEASCTTSWQTSTPDAASTGPSTRGTYCSNSVLPVAANPTWATPQNTTRPPTNGASDADHHRLRHRANTPQKPTNCSAVSGDTARNGGSGSISPAVINDWSCSLSPVVNAAHTTGTTYQLATTNAVAATFSRYATS